MKIPFSPPYITQSVLDEVMDSLQSGWITTGPKVKKLEEMIGHYTGAKNALGVNSATSGLILALKWLGVKKGDEVIIPAYTYSATALAVIHAGATPVMVDVKDDFNISIEEIEKKITDKTKAIIPVDIGGWPCDYDEIMKITTNSRHLFTPESVNQEKLGRILVLSDAAHSLGAKYNGTYLGASADLTVFSFHAVKNVTTAEGGAICLNLPEPFSNEDEYKYLRCFSLNGQTKDAFTKSQAGGWKYDIVYPGIKVNLPDVLAAIGIAQLPEYFDSTLHQRKDIFSFYQDFFQQKTWAILPKFQDNTKVSSCHIYALRIADCSEEQRDEIMKKIAEKEVSVNVHFQPLPLLSVFKDMGFEIADFPSAYQQYKCEISLPIYPQLKEEQLNFITQTVSEAVESVL
ncbi:DegT/DnrJ/EryC1/StrS family aminotransferase [Mangrovimonas futianensis]|uniref:DegT/DnrJ/EryC1/StrS family aminotransferase n=1 Tax=Mangrovimonas futianensis TaxID=2895523 RepID=UPI001E362D91|nr:DegT/DnrJ/EryC1/StrS family aminotransferase [Mangrovimonas futianensis]MCF1421963.1 DegT/DnrJ/EryC1/StrS family aminotransferase [Mangrovimonas futianensis]